MKRWLGLSLGLWMLGCAGAGTKPATSKQPVPSAALPALETGLVFGTDDPYTLLGFDPQAQWLALCQARQDTNGDGITRVGFFHHGERSGDEMQTYFVLGGGEGEAVDAFLGSSASGAWVALRQGPEIFLLDTRSGKKRDLGVVRLDREPDPSAAGGIRNLSFAPEQERLMLVEEAKLGQAGVAVMDLVTGTVQRLDMGPGRVWQGGFSKDGSWLLASVVTRDRDGNGKLDLPTIATNLGGDACGQAASYSTFGLKEPHDEMTQVAVPLAGGKWRAVERPQGTLDGDLVWTRPDGALVRESPAGKQQVLASATCRGAVLDYYSLENERWLVACAKPQAAPSAAADGDQSLPPPREQATEVWIFGKGLPPQGKPTGLSLEYGAEPGHFGTHRYSNLRTGRGVFLYDLQKLEAIAVPEGFETCAGKDGHYLLQAEGSGVYQWSPGTAPQLVTTETECDRLDDRYALLGTSVFDWTERKLVGTVAPLCQGRDCRKLTYAPFSPTQHFLRRRARATGRDAAALDERLRESLASFGAKTYAERGPLRFESWSPLASATPVAQPESDEVEARLSLMQPPPASCEPLVAEVTAKPSTLPAWTVVRPVGGSLATFPSWSGARDEQPTFEHLAQQLCSARDISFALDDLEQVAARAQAKPAPPSGDSPLQPFEPELSPAFEPLQSVASSCSTADTCRLGVIIADSRYQRVKAEVAPKLLLACDAATAGDRLRDLRAQPLLELEWLVAGKGRKPGSAARVQALLDQILASKDRYDMEKAVALLAADERPEVTAVLLATRAGLAKAPVPVAVPGLANAGGPPETPFGVDQLDVSLHTTRSPRLQKLYRDACRRLTTGKEPDWSVKFACRAAEPGEKPAQVEYRFLDRLPRERRSEVTSLSSLLEPAEQKKCAEAFAGKCPALPVFKLSSGNVWQALYVAAVEVTKLPSSPIAGGLLDTPLRSHQRKLTAAWRLWQNGELYEAGPAVLTAASLPWAQKLTALPTGEALAIRGFLAWLNGVARARGSSQRFFYARRVIDNYLIMATEQQACALNGATSFQLSQDPVTRDPFH